MAVDFAWSLKEGVSLISEHDYTLALVDLTLPDAMNGEVAKYTHQKHPDRCPNLVDEYIRQQMLELGVVDYVVKDNRDSYHYAIKLVAQLLRNDGSKALVADDSVLSRTLMKQMLEKQLFDVRDAQDGEQALQMFKDDPEIKPLLRTMQCQQWMVLSSLKRYVILEAVMI